jgi:hypothetical protein
LYPMISYAAAAEGTISPECQLASSNTSKSCSSCCSLRNPGAGAYTRSLFSSA